MMPAACDFAQVSKADRDDKNLEGQLLALARYGIRRDIILIDDRTGTSFKRPVWEHLRERVQPGTP